jgi:hypothetical protein
MKSEFKIYSTKVQTNLTISSFDSEYFNHYRNKEMTFSHPNIFSYPFYDNPSPDYNRLFLPALFHEESADMNSSDKRNQGNLSDLIQQTSSEKPFHDPLVLQNDVTRVSTLASKRKRLQKRKDKKYYTPTKNLLKNYGKAICNFILGKIGKTYWKFEINEDSLAFNSYIHIIKEDLDSISGLRSKLLFYESDTEETKKFKMEFRRLALIFLRDFCLNWIFHSEKIKDKNIALTYRFKLIRRIEHPDLFVTLR